MAKLITELTHDISVEIVEDVNKKKNYYIEGPFMVAESKNKNGRIYPTKVLEKALKDFLPKINESKNAFGELGHPPGPGLNLDLVSHRIIELRTEGNVIMGKAKILDTPRGNVVKTLLDEGSKLGVSTRGLGTLKEKDGIMEVQDDFRLITVDIVNDPSGPGCFVNGIMEGVDWVYDAALGEWREEKIVEERPQTTKKMTLRELEEARYRALESFLKTLKQ